MENGLEAELDDELGYSKYDCKNKDTDNSRNGHSHKTLRTSFGDVAVYGSCIDDFSREPAHSRTGPGVLHVFCAALHYICPNTEPEVAAARLHSYPLLLVK